MYTLSSPSKLNVIKRDSGTKEAIFRSAVAVVQSYSVEESAERLTLFRNKISEQVLGELVGSDPKRKDGSYTERTNVSITGPEV